MTAADRLFSYFPLLMTVLSLAALGVFAQWPSLWSAILLLFVLYVLPPTVQRVMFRWAPLKQGIACIDGRLFCPWLASHHIQAFYDALPYLESLLRELERLGIPRRHTPVRYVEPKSTVFILRSLLKNGIRGVNHAVGAHKLQSYVDT